MIGIPLRYKGYDSSGASGSFGHIATACSCICNPTYSWGNYIGPVRETISRVRSPIIVSSRDVL